MEHTVYFKQKLNNDYVMSIIDELFLTKNNDFVITSQNGIYEITFTNNTFEFSKIVFSDYDSFADICFYLLNKHNEVYSSKKNSPRI